MLRLVRAVSAVGKRQRPLEFVAPPEPPQLTEAAARVLAELIRRADRADGRTDEGSTAA